MGGVPGAVYRDPGAALTDPHLLQRGAFATITDGAGEFVGVNAPWKMSAARTSMQPEVPAIGAHREELLSRVLGLSPEAVARLAGQGCSEPSLIRQGAGVRQILRSITLGRR